jgi:diguanylate cyclase (GGDEF)-like protein/PAS domain S-box-containing protein
MELTRSSTPARAAARRPSAKDRVTAQLEELRAVHEVAKRAAALDVEGTLDAVVTAFEQLTTADSTAIYLWSLETKDALQLAAYRFDRALYPADYEEKLKGRVSARGYGLIGWVAEHREPLMIGNAARDPRARAIPGIPLDNKSAIVVPVIANEELLGVIRAVKMGLNAFRPEHFRLAQTLAHQSAVAIAAAEAQREQKHRLEENERLAAVLQARETRLRAVIAASPLAIIELDLEGRVRLWNEASHRIFGWTADEILGGPALLVPPEQEDEDRGLIARVCAGDSIDDHETVRCRKDGTRIEVAISAAPLRGELNEVIGMTELIADITSRKNAERQLAHQALHDALTDLPNRALLQDRLEQAIALARRQGTTVALLLMDLDDFKDVNDTYGHAAGDALLRELGPRLLRRLRQTDTLARLGGDEFAVVLQSVGARSAERIANSLRGALRMPFTVEGHVLELDTSIGISLFPSHAENADLLMRRADVAMYEAKRTKAGVVVHNPQLAATSAGRLAAVAELRRAIDQNELRVHFQPIVALPGGRLLGVEALVRWAHRERGLLDAGAFVPLAEHGALSAPLTAWVLRNALAQAKRALADRRDLFINVNLSPRDVADPDLPRRVEAALAEAGLDPERLCLEVTEGTLITDTERCGETLHALRAIGCQIAIDDFGAGYSSLTYLDRLPLHVLKIDRSFVARLAAGSASRAIVRAIVDLAHDLGLLTVAEGVEDEHTYQVLAQLGCDAAQGFYIARPLAPDALADWIRTARPSALGGLKEDQLSTPTR